MADFQVTGPDGKKYIVSAPEGATQEQATAFASQSFAQPAEAPSDTFGSAMSVGLKAALAPGKALFGPALKAQELLDKAAYNAGGAVTDATGSPALGFATNVATQAVPTVLSGNLAKGAAPALEAGAKKLTQQAINPKAKDLATQKAERAIETILEKWIPVTEGGRKATQLKTFALEDEITGILKNSGATVDPNSVAFKTLQESIAKVTHEADPIKAMKIIDKSVNTFLAHPLVEGKQAISVLDAHKLKQAITKSLGDNKFGVGLPKQPTDVMTDKVRAGVLREAEGAAEPRVIPSLKEQSDLINALKVMGPPIKDNRMTVGLGGPFAQSLPQFLIWMADRSPWFKSRLAQLMYHGSEQIPATAARVGTGGVMATQGQD